MEKSLQNIQTYFQNFLLNDKEDIVTEVVSSEQAPALLRLDVYRNAYYLRIIDVVAMDYPITKHILGQDYPNIITDYIRTYPSKHFSLHVFGRNLATFLSTYPSIEPYITEMAAFEWKLAEVLGAKDAPIVTIEAMSTIAPEQWSSLTFSLHPSVQLLPLYYNIPELWRLARENETEINELQKKRVKSEDKPQHWVIWRYNLEAYYAPLDETQLYMLEAIKAGKTFGEICEELCQWLEEDYVIQFAAGNLRNWVNDGIFSNLSF